jgi:glutamate dehydrogenase (NAD(P)+)
MTEAIGMQNVSLPSSVCQAAFATSEKFFIDGIEFFRGETLEETKLDEMKRAIDNGADEIDLVRSGLEETMIFAYNEIREIKKQDKRIEDLRTAAFVSGIRKLGVSYQALGIFP